MTEKPFIHLLRWHRHYYFFDVNRNQLLKVTKELYEELEREQKGAQERHTRAYEELKELGFLSSNKIQVMEHPQTEAAEELVNHELNQLTLQVTQDCNFRCSYCIYSDINNEGQRHHEKRFMDFQTAKKAVDYFYRCSDRAERLSIGFYGGEPLLNFSLIQRVVEYVEPLFAGRHCQFTITTNASLLTQQVQDFVVKHDFSLAISLDGSEKIQNIHRRFAANGKGSYQTVMHNLMSLKKRYPEWFEKKVGLSMVIDPRNDYDEILPVFQTLGKESGINATAINDVYSLQKTYFTEGFLWKQRYHQFLALVEAYRGEEIDGVSREARQMIASLKKDKIQYLPVQHLAERQVPGGPCIPGSTKLFVTVVGEFYPCERVSEINPCMKIGSLEEGIDITRVKKMMNFSRETQEVCRSCWAVLHCDQCLRNVDNHGSLSGKVRLRFCEGTRKRVEDTLLDFAAFQEFRKMGGEWREGANDDISL